jgi:nitronate monooxygenase
LFSGVHANYLRSSIVAAGLDPDNLARPDDAQAGKLVFKPKAKAWKDIWGVGQGIGTISDIPDVASLVDRLEAEYRAAKERLLQL